MLSYSADQTYTLEDLGAWAFDGISLAVLGHPVRHSLSPAMHNAALQALAPRHPELANWRYFRFDIQAERLGEALPLFYSKGFAGLNLTVPHKEIAFALLRDIDPAADRIGAVNTLKRTDGFFVGYNTDGYGLSQGIAESLDARLADFDVILLGAGGASRAAAAQCIDEGCRSLTIVNRSPERLAALIETLRPFAQARDIPLSGTSPDHLTRATQDALLINGTSLGLKDDDPSPFPASASTVPKLCYDMIYNPPVTKLMNFVEAQGGRSANGLSMLVHQGAQALKIWTGQTPPVDVMRRAATSALSH